MKMFTVSVILMLTLSGCLLESVGPINRTIKPYGAHWVKEGMTRESRLADWVSCGGDRSGSFSPSIKTLSDGEGAGISREQIRRRLEAEADSCMIKLGYTFVRN